jgi:probable F420-dependent oxidoreductase
MRIGMQPATSGPQATPEAITATAELADRLGFDSLQVTDHVVIPLTIESRYPYHPSGQMRMGPDADYFEAISLLGYLAGRTRRIRLGTSVLVAAYRNPVVTARQLACLDVLSGGRMLLGVGVGWMAEEFAAVGAPPFGERGAVTDEVIEVLRCLWRDQPAAYSGRFFSFAPVGAMPKPAQPNGIPILIGGNTKPAIRRAARLGDGWQPIKISPDELSARLGYLREQAALHDRDLSAFSVSLRMGLRLSHSHTQRRDGEDRWGVLAGAAEQVADDLAAYEKVGVTEMVFDFRTCSPEETTATLHLAAEHLIPRFRGAEHAAGG